MAFVCILEDECPFTVAVTPKNREAIAIIPIGYDDETDIDFKMLVTLSPIPGYGEDGYELAFAIIEIEDGCETLRWNGLDTRRAIPDPGHRSLIRAALGLAVQRLIDDTKPSIISMFTYEADLPPAALRKFHDVGLIIKAAGYRGGRADPYHGRHVWMFERAES